jgi:serine protease AprX
LQRTRPRSTTIAVHAQDRRIVAVGIVLSALIAASLPQPTSGSPTFSLRLLVHETTPSSRVAEDTVHALGGTVTRQLPLIDGFAAILPEDRVPMLARDASVAELSVDGRIRMASAATEAWDDVEPNLAWRKTIRLHRLPDGVDGSGVTVAMIDTGVAHVDDLGDRVLARVDFTPGGNGDDKYGHGTHLAGVIAGDGSSSSGKWRGVAPGARLVSVKVAGPDGSTDVSVVIAALQWVVTHRHEYGIKVLNLAFGTDSLQSYTVDPLNAAVERAWAAGITVVVSAGNRGPGTINKPGDDPYVITVGAVDVNRTVDRWDDEVASFSSSARTVDGFLKPDLVAPGTTIVAPRVVGSTVDALHPEAVLDGSYLKGTGTSQAGAIVSGVAALLYQVKPWLRPNAVKSILLENTIRHPQYRSRGGAGLVDAADAVQGFGIGDWTNAWLTRGTGRGSLEASRGRFHVHADLDGDGRLDLVEGERDVLGDPWDSTSWSSTSWSSTSWSSLISENAGWSSTSWSSTSWSGMSWSSTSWSSTSWSSTSWSSTTWS